jgi:hypothetical protein
MPRWLAAGRCWSNSDVRNPSADSSRCVRGVLPRPILVGFCRYESQTTSPGGRLNFGRCDRLSAAPRCPGHQCFRLCGEGLIAIEHAVVVRWLQLSKLRGMTALSQAAGFQPAYAASGGESDPKRLKRPMQRATLPAASVAAFIGHIANPTAMTGSEAERSYKCPRDRARERLFLAEYCPLTPHA